MLTNVNTSFHSFESDQLSSIVNPLDMNGISGTVIEPVNELQGFLTDGSAEFSEEQLQADLVNSMAAPSEVLA